MALASNAFQINEFSIIPLEGNTQPIDLSQSTLFIDYYESIISPNIVVEVLLTNITSLVNAIPIRGGEKVSLNVTITGRTLDFTGENSLYVYEIGERSSTDTSEFFLLRLITKEAITNETVRCVKRYDGKIDESVKDILKNVLNTKKFKDNNIHSTANSYSFIGTMKKPFTMLYWLCSKSLPLTNSIKTKEVNKQGNAKGVSGFLFYENSEGFNFKSVDDLVKRTNIGTDDKKDVPSYTSTGVIETDTPSNEYKILNYSFEKNVNLISSLQRGTYSNVTYFYNFYTQKFSLYKYFLKEEITNANKLGTNDTIPIPKSIEVSPSRIMFRSADVGIMDKSPDNTNFDGSYQRDIADMAKSISRYNILFSQSLNIVVPCNASLKVGDIIEVLLPQIGTGNDNKKMDEEQSGLYLIHNLHHHIEPGKSGTSLKLIRDSYGLYGAKNIN